MNLSGDSVLWVIGAGASLAGFVFQFAFYLGKLTQEVKSLREDSDKHEEAINQIQQRRADRLQS